LGLVLIAWAGCSDESATDGSILGVGGNDAESQPSVAGVSGSAGMQPVAGTAGGGTEPVPSTGAPIGGMAGEPMGGAAGDDPLPMDGSTADGGAVDSMVPAEIPDPVTEPYAWGFGIGVTDIPAAVEFYTTVMELTVEKEVVRSDRTETILYAAEAQRGARLILMKFNDNRETRRITTKLVWQSSSASSVNRAASTYPDYVSRITFPVVQFDGPDTYIQEVGSIFDSEGGAIAVPYLVAMGFSVSDLAAARSFYSTGLGMEEAFIGSFPVTDATGSGTITEYSERHPAGAGLVLQDWSPERNSKDNPVKVVLFVPDAQAAADAVVAADGSIVEPATRTEVYDNRLLIVAKDLDGYVLELVQ
jgi:catechol 2,3-dioxygenase-like lactoylglutathione lyase family enzyme